ncbi:MAG: aminotransferase class I/II-fold pyridoxal phosphate-dependent enzyme, partial [Gemmatimonadota bacterium]|nr:aminotransferase class I/II-fold pyridoxal phosphate-dependent enzyme [Gemmatimonadota bacterium]
MTGPPISGAGPETRGTREPARLASLPPYPLAGLPEARARLLAEGREVMDLGAGDPGLPVPAEAVEALAEGASRPELQRYGFQRGLPRFRRAVVDFMHRRYGKELDPEAEILPLIGSKEGLANLAFATLDPGDVALVPDPGYAPYFGGPHMAGGRVRKVPLLAERDFIFPPQTLRRVEDDVRLVYLNYPNNPTGACVDRAYLAEVAEAVLERK